MIKHVKLGSTDLTVSCVGLGTVKFGRNQGVKYPTEFSLPTDSEILHLLDYAQSLGINLLDTAPAYGISEERLGKLLKANRKNWILCTKVGETFENGESHFDFSHKAILSSIERSLKRLNTDVLDMVLVHSDGNDKAIIESGVFDTLNDLKKKGSVRAIGMSTKTVEGGILAVDQSDVVMVTYNPITTEEQPVIEHAHKKHKGILIKKALASGHLQKIQGQDPVLSAMQFIFQEPGVHSVILGTLSLEHLKHDVMCAERALS